MPVIKANQTSSVTQGAIVLDMGDLRKQGDAVHAKYAPEINKMYPDDTLKTDNFLKQVQEYMGYKP